MKKLQEMFRGGGLLKCLLSIIAAVAMVGTVAGVGVAAYADGDSRPIGTFVVL